MGRCEMRKEWNWDDKELTLDTRMKKRVKNKFFSSVEKSFCFFQPISLLSNV